MRTGKNIVLFTLIVMNFVDQPAPEVTIDQGTLSGRISGNGLVFEYLGIPYATTNQSSRFKVSNAANIINACVCAFVTSSSRTDLSEKSVCFTSTETGWKNQ